MRFLFRLVVLALAALGAKTLYDMLAPKQDQLRSSADTFLDRTTSAARDVGAKVTGAAKNLASTAQSNAADVKDAALEGADRVRSAAEQARDELAQDGDPDTNGAAVGGPTSADARG